MTSRGLAPASLPRAFNTCQECRRRKLRCDKARPTCQRCQNSGVACTYEDRHFNFVNNGPRQNAVLEDHSNASSFSVPITSERLENVESRLEALTAMVQSIQNPRAHNPAVQGGFLDNPPLKSRSNQAISGHLSVQEGGRMRYVEPSFWACISDEVAKIDDLLRGQNRYDSSFSESEGDHEATVSESESSSSNTATSSKYTIGDILSKPPAWSGSSRSSSPYMRPFPNLRTSLPSKSQCDVLLHAFTWNYHPIVPLVHSVSLHHEHDTFWHTNSGQGAEMHCNASYIPVLLAVWYAGSVVCSPKAYQEAFPATAQHSVSTNLYKMACRGLRFINFPRTPTVESLTAYLILQGTWMRDEEPLTCCAFVGTAVRVAQMLGLNREPSQFPSISPLAAEIRRRVWWHIFHVDVLVSLASGLPPLIDQGSWNVHPVSELREEHIGTAAGLRYENDVLQTKQPHSVDSDSMISSIGILLAGKHQDSMASRNLMSRLYSDRSMTRNDVTEMQQQLEDFKFSMSSRAARIPIVTREHTLENNATFNEWSRVLLLGWGDKHWSFAYSPLLNRAVSDAWMDLYPGIIHKCRTWVRKVVYLSCKKEFQPYFWAWPGNHQPLHSIMVLIREVDRNPTAMDAEASRHVVDEVMALCGIDGGLTGNSEDQVLSRPLNEGGKESWDLIKRLRAEAWSKAGVDPDVLMTRAEVQKSIKTELEEDDALDATFLPHQYGYSLTDDDMNSSLADAGGPIPNLFWNEWGDGLGARGGSMFEYEGLGFG